MSNHALPNPSIEMGPPVGGLSCQTLGLNMADPKEIDFSAKKTEAEWQEKLDTFFLAATPKLFEWLRWVITLSALTYVQHKTKFPAVSVLLGVTYFLTVSYFIAFFYQFRFRGFPLLKSPRVALFTSLLLSGLLGGVTFLLVNEAVSAFVSTQP